MQMSNWLPEPGSPVDRVVTFVAANLMWFMFSVFIITLPAATAGLFATLAPWIRGRDVEMFGTFFGTMRRQWRKSTVIGIIDVVLGVIIVVNLRALGFMEISGILVYVIGSVNLFLGLTLLMVNLYIWPLLVLFDLPLRRLITVSLRLVLVHPFWSMLVLGVAALPLIVALFVPPLISLVAVFSAVALIINWGTWRIIKKYATPEELAQLNHPSASN